MQLQAISGRMQEKLLTVAIFREWNWDGTFISHSFILLEFLFRVNVTFQNKVLLEKKKRSPKWLEPRGRWTLFMEVKN